jgi:hypothetical protein
VRKPDEAALNGAKSRPNEWRISTRLTRGASTVAAVVGTTAQKLSNIVASKNEVDREMLDKLCTIYTYPTVAASKSSSSRLNGGRIENRQREMAFQE